MNEAYKEKSFRIFRLYLSVYVGTALDEQVDDFDVSVAGRVVQWLQAGAVARAHVGVETRDEELAHVDAIVAGGEVERRAQTTLRVRAVH